MPSRWLAWPALAWLVLSVYSGAQDKPTEIRLTVKRNARTVPNPHHIVLSASDYAGKVTVTDGRFDVPSEILHAKSFSFSADVVGNHIEIVNLSQSELHYEDWTLLLADRRYPEDYASSIPKGADISHSCMLVLDSEHLDPGVVMFQERCRSKRADDATAQLRCPGQSGPFCFGTNMNQQPTPASGANGHSAPEDIFMLTDEQILEIEPEPQDVQVRAAQPGVQSGPRSGESGEQHGPYAGSAQGAPPCDPSSTAAENAPSQPTEPTAPFAKPEDVRALAELYPGGLNQAKTAAERARTLDEIDAAYFGAGGNSPEQISAARTQLAQRMLREDPAAFREMVFAGLRALEAAQAPVAQSIPAVPPANSTAAPAPAAPRTQEAQPGLSAPPQHLAAYVSFEKAANEELERSVGGAIDRALHQALPNLGRGDESANAGARHGVPLQARLGAAIRDEVEKALQGDRQLGEQVAQILSARRFDNETRAQVVRLIGERAQQLVPGAAKRALNDWTQATLAAHRAATRHSDTNASRVDLSPATGQGSPGQVASTHSATSARSENARAASARAAHASKSSRVDYRRLSDDQILDL